MTKLFAVFFNEVHQHVIDFAVKPFPHFANRTANSDGRQVEFPNELLAMPGRRMLANVERAEQILEVVSRMNIIVLTERVEESRLSEATRPEEYVSEISSEIFELLDINCLVCKYHSCLSAEYIEVWNPIWNLQLLQILNVKSDQVGK